MSADDPFVHPCADIERGAHIGPGTRVWRHSHIRTGARIGANCVISANVFVDAGVRVGDEVKVQNNVSLYAGVELEGGVFVGPSAVFTNDLLPRAISPGWQITPTVICRGASIGANATVVCGNDIGEYAMVGAGAVVTRPVPAHALVLGNPGRIRGWVCACGVIVARQNIPPDSFMCVDCSREKVS